MRLRLWILLACGSLVFPVAARFVNPVPGLPFPPMMDFDRGLAIWSAWAIGFAEMAVAMCFLRRVGLRTLMAAQIAAGLVFVFVQAMPSIDTYVYFGFGSLLLHGDNPWNAGHVVPFDDFSLAYTNAWGNEPPSSPYGPAFVLAEAAFVHAMHGVSTMSAVIGQRLLSLAAAVGITALVRGPKIRFWALNPFVFYYYVLEAHNDIFFLLLLAAAARIRAPFFRGLLIGIAGSIKVVALVATAWTNPKRILATVAGALVSVVILYRLEPLALGITGLQSMTSNFANSIDYVIFETYISNGIAFPGVRAVESVVLSGVVIVALSLRWSRRDALTFVALLFIIALPIFWPWYLGWALLASLASSHRATHRLVVALSVFSFVNEIPSISGFHNVVQVTWAFIAIALVLPFASGFVSRYVTWPWKEGTPLWRARAMLPLAG